MGDAIHSAHSINITMRSFQILVAFALAFTVSALPSTDEAVPETELAIPEFPPATEFATATEYEKASVLVSKKGDKACTDLADAAETEGKENVKNAQDILSKIDNGANCAKEGQDAVKSAKAPSEQAKAKKTKADQDYADAQGAKVNFGDFSFNSLNPNNCQGFFASSVYTNAKAKVDAATTAAASAAGEVKQAATAVQNAITAAESAATKCKCKAFKAHEVALAASNTKVAAANKAAWTKAALLKCVIAGTSYGSCTVPAIPKVKAVTLAAGVDNSACEADLATFPLKTKYGSYNQCSNAKLVDKGGNKDNYQCTNGCDQDNYGGTTEWHRGCFGPWEIQEKDLPLSLSFTYNANGQSASNNYAYEFAGFNSVKNDGSAPHYDCTFDFAFRFQPAQQAYEYRHGCSSTQGSGAPCYINGGHSDNKMRIHIAKDGKVRYYVNGKFCMNGKNKATSSVFPLYFDTSMYGLYGTFKDISLKKE